MAEWQPRVRWHAPGAGEVSQSEDAGMVPSGRRSLRRELQALLEDQARAACGSGRQGRRQSEEVPKESSEVIDNHGEDSLDPGFFGRGMGSELRNMLERFQGDFKKVLRTKRKQFVTETNAALKGINQKIGNAVKKRQEQRQTFYHEYYQQFLTLFGEWNRDVEKTKKEEEKLIILFHKQRNLFKKARTVQNQRLRKIKNLYDQFVKEVQSLEENQNCLAINERKEFRQEMAKLRRKIVVDVQRQELANIRKSIQCLLL